MLSLGLVAAAALTLGWKGAYIATDVSTVSVRRRRHDENATSFEPLPRVRPLVPPLRVEYAPNDNNATDLPRPPPEVRCRRRRGQIRIALLVVGGVRSFAEPRCRGSLLANYVTPLREQGADVTQFWHLSLTEKSTKSSDLWAKKGRAGADLAERERSLGEARAALDPEVVTYYDAARKRFPGTVVDAGGLREMANGQLSFLGMPLGRGMFEGQHVGNRNCSTGREKDGLSGFYPQFHSQSEAFRSVVEYETECEAAFDWVIRIRPDLTWVEPLRPDFVQSLMVRYSVTAHAATATNMFFFDANWKLKSDLVFAIPRPSAAVFYANMPQIFGRVPCNATETTTLDPEGGLILSLAEMGFHLEEMELGTYSISRPGIQECSWNADHRLDACCRAGFLLLDKVPIGCNDDELAGWRNYDLVGQPELVACCRDFALEPLGT